MKRDMVLVRQILLALEAQQEHRATVDLPIAGYKSIEVRYHMLILAQAGLVDFEPERTEAGRMIRAYVFGLTWSGHEFLDAVRSNKIWRKLLRHRQAAGCPLPFDLMKTLATELLTHSAHLHKGS